YTLDAGGRVTAFSASSGAEVWRMSVTPPNEKDQEGFGGGLAADGGRIYAGTGFGYVVALDARTGNKLWGKSLEAPVRASRRAVRRRRGATAYLPGPRRDRGTAYRVPTAAKCGRSEACPSARACSRMPAPPSTGTSLLFPILRATLLHCTYPPDGPFGRNPW